MNQDIIQKLKSWRINAANTTGVELFRVLPNKVLEDIARLKPTSKEDLLAIKGIREKKFEKYGRDILAIIKESESGHQIENENDQIEDKIYTVSDYLDILTLKLSQAGAAVRGEISGLNFRKDNVYFDIKDSDGKSIMHCFMWARNYEMCGIDLEEGMDIIVHGAPEVYKPYGKLSFQTSVIELVGEGALKKAYDELKKKLEAEGLFAVERKKPIPAFPQKIGLITSRDGAVIGDFSSNIGQFGYKITFMDSRVEGAAAISDLIEAVSYFEDKDIDVLVIIRGGGSLESLQAFNNEMLVRKVADLKMPVICGIGHDKDIPLLSYVADKAVSTPTAVAGVLNESWERARDIVYTYEQNILDSFENALREDNHKLEIVTGEIKDFHSLIFGKFEKFNQLILHYFNNIRNSILFNKNELKRIAGDIVNIFRNNLNETSGLFNNFEKVLKLNNPERQLIFGYSITKINGKIIKSVQQVKPGDQIDVSVSDGKIESEVKKITNN